MPVRYGNQSNTYKTGEGVSTDNHIRAMYRSSPELSQMPPDHRRTSSNDSLDGSYHGGHSRQSSSSSDNYPTRPNRRTSSSTADPLQFVKFHRQTELAKQAEEQMKLAANQKEHKVVVAEDKEEDVDWLSNLSKWKSRRKSQSHQAYQLKDDLEAQNKEDDTSRSSIQTKTFSQMQQERDRRKSATSRNFYPLDEDATQEPIAGDATQEPLGEDASKEEWVSVVDRGQASWAQGSYEADKEQEPADDPFDAIEQSPRDKPLPAKRRSWNNKPENGSHKDTSDTKSITSSLRKQYESADHHQSAFHAPRQWTSGDAQKEEFGDKSAPVLQGRGQGDLNIQLSLRAGESSGEVGMQDSSSLSQDLDSPRKTSPRQGRDYTEKIIKISHKPKSEKGFGFTICGGKDLGEPITVLKVSLGSAADVCEVMSRDEILAINKESVSDWTHQEAQDLIQQAVASGQLELRVRRCLANSQQEMEDEFLSSDEEVEAFGQSQHSASIAGFKEDFRAAVNNNPVASALRESTGHDSTDSGWPAVQGEVVSEAEHADHGHAGSQREYSVDLSVEKAPRSSSRPRPSPAGRETRREIPQDTIAGSDLEGPTSNSDEFGPPAILRKWQRQRPPQMLGNESSPGQSLASSLPWMDNNLPNDNRGWVEEEGDQEISRMSRTDLPSRQNNPPVPSPRTYNMKDQFQDLEDGYPEQQKVEPLMEEELERVGSISDVEQRVGSIIDPDQRVGSVFDPELRVRPVFDPEQRVMPVFDPEQRVMPVFDPEQRLVPVYDLEQRQGPNYGAAPNETQISISGHQIEPVTEHTQSSMSFQVKGYGEAGQPQPTVLVIDPRNRGEESGYNMVVKLNQDGRAGPRKAPTQVNLPSVVDIEAIREEERRKIVEEERKKREEEEERRFREKEAQLREQEELLRQKEERLRQEQEQFLLEQKELKRKQVSRERKTDVRMFEAPVSRVREASPSYMSTVTKRHPEVVPSAQSPRFSSTVVVEPKSHYDSKSMSLGRETRLSQDLGDRSRWSREDMLAMNRKATPLQSSPDVPHTGNLSNAGPIKRQSLSRQQVHSLNAVPKPKFRSSQDWIGSESSPQYNPHLSTSRHSEIMKKQYVTPQEHWLFEEAERRRKQSNFEPQSQSRQYGNSQFSGPIKPTADNHWREEQAVDRQITIGLSSSFDSSVSDNNNNMPAAIRQTLLQKTASVRGGTPGNSYAGDPSATYIQPGDVPVGSHQPLPDSSPTWAPPQSDRQGFMTLSGRQHCSHCNQELGYGAAMIIESLGLSYHVQCFKCCVCHTPLGNGSEGADVRVRVNKLHCPNCYSNDEAGLKFSKV